MTTTDKASVARFALKGKSMNHKSDTPATSAPDHWRRYRRLMLVMVSVALLTVATAFAVLHYQGVPLRLHLVIALGLAITFSLLLAGALMGLVFVSARSGHDDGVQ